MSIGDDVRQRIRGGCRAQSRGGALGRGRRGEEWRRGREGVTG
nr:unknown [Zea mays]